MKKLIYVLLVLAMVVFSGCLKNVSGPSQYVKENTIYQKIAIYDEALIQECKLGECVCLACTNRTSWFGFVKSYVGGYCSWVRNCTPERFSNLANGTLYPEAGPREFMIGQGYSFSDFSAANGYCGNKMDMAVHWLTGSNTSNYSLPDADRAMCMLYKEVIPVYVLYSNGQNINPEQTYLIANELGSGGPSYGPGGIPLPVGSGPVGPVIITTEIDFNSSDPDVIDNVTKQIQQINAGCKNDRTKDPAELYCLVALAPKMGDYNATKIILEDKGMADQVDLIAFGINSHTANLNYSAEAFCSPDAVYLQGLSFARTCLYNYSKPTVVPYVMFDSKGTDSSGKCTWNEAKMIEGYAAFYSKHLIAFQKAGTIGVSAYDFNTSTFEITNPLGCYDCALGANNNRLAAWFGSCRSYKEIAAKYPAGDNMILFSNESGGLCDYNSNPVGILQMQYGSEFNSITPKLTPPNISYIRCDACVNENLTFPFDIYPTAVVTNDVNKEKYCESVPAIEYYAGKRSLDPMLVRALIIAESGFDPCAAAKVYPTGGVDSSCYPKAYNRVPDPDPNSICQNGPAPLVNNQPQYRYCALGIMQTLIPPYTFWPYDLYPGEPGVPATQGEAGPLYHVDGDYLYQEARAAGRSGESAIPFVKSECSLYFNPFNATHSVCYGTEHLKNNLETATKYVDANKAALGVSDDPNKQRVLSYYLALHYYRGYGGYIKNWTTDFQLQKTYDAAYFSNLPDPTVNPLYSDYLTHPDCYGQKDFIRYVRECEFKSRKNPSTPNSGNRNLYYGDYGSRILAYYKDLSDKCDNAGCPSWKKIAKEACANYEQITSWPPPPGTQCVLIKNK